MFIHYDENDSKSNSFPSEPIFNMKVVIDLALKGSQTDQMKVQENQSQEAQLWFKVDRYSVKRKFTHHNKILKSIDKQSSPPSGAKNIVKLSNNSESEWYMT